MEDDPGILPRLKSQYNDPLSGLVKAKAELLSCFSEMNYDVGLLAASNRLKNFMEDYEIEYDDKLEDQSNKLDNLEKNIWFKEGADLSETSNGKSNILKIYKITRKLDGKSLETFDPDTVCPSYTIKPFLRHINKDARTNNYTLDIDWTCVKTAYLRSNNPDPEKIEKTTAHYFKPDVNALQQEAQTDITSAYDTLKKCNTESTIAYPVSLTKKGEAEAIKNTYFNTSDDNEDGYISLAWDAHPQGDKVNGFDALFAGAPVKDHSNGEGGYEYLVNSDSLAKSGLTIQYKNKKHPEKETDPVRFDDLVAVSGARSRGSVELLENQDQLVKDFIENCSGWADTSTSATCISNSGEYSATSSVYADYKNTLYKPAEQSGGKYISYCAAEAVEVDNYKLSNDSYDYLISEYNTDEDFVSDYKKNKFKSEYKSAKTMSIVEGCFLVLTILGCGLTIAKAFAPAFVGKLPIYILIVTLAFAGTIGQIVMMSLNASKKAYPLGKFVDRLDAIKDSHQINDFDNKLKKSAEENCLPRYNQDSHTIPQKDYNDGYKKYAETSNFFEEVLPTMEYYQNISKEPTYQSCMDIIDENDVDPQEYLDEMEVWDSKGSCTISYWSLFAGTFLMDVTVIVLTRKNPELSDLEIMKQAEAKARESGEASESIVKTYQELYKVKKELEALKAAAKEAGTAIEMTADATKDIAGRAAMQGLKEAGITPGITSTVEATANAGKEFTNRLSALSAIPEIKTVSSLVNNVSKAGNAGISGVLRTMTGMGNAAHAITEADRFILQFALKSFDKIISFSQKTAKLTGELAHLQVLADFVKTLNSSSRTVLQFTVKTAQEAMQLGKCAEAFNLIQKIDTILYDTANITTKFATAGELIGTFDHVTQSLYRIVSNVYYSLDLCANSVGIFTILV